MTLPRAAQFDTSSYSARRVIFIWIGLCIAGWAIIFSAIRALALLAEFFVA
jgi:hypothetical protein